MSLHTRPVGPVPEETARVVHAAFPGGNTYMALRDELGTIFRDEDFAALYPGRGRPAESPWRLALVTVFQFAEGPSDRRAADAVRGRIDWKYDLGLGLDDPGFDASVLCEFRARLVAGSAEGRLLDALLELCRGRGWLKARGRRRTDATHDADHKLITDIVNRAHLGWSKNAVLPDSDHLFHRFATEAESLKDFGKGQFNPAFIRMTKDWIDAVMASKE